MAFLAGVVAVVEAVLADEVVSVTGWSRDNARRRLTSATQRPPGSLGRHAAQEAAGGKHSYDALKVLHRVWAASGGQCGKYLAVSMGTQLDGLERHGELVASVGRYGRAATANELVSLAFVTAGRARESGLAVCRSSIWRSVHAPPRAHPRPSV